MAEPDWIDISIPLGKAIPELPLEASDADKPRSRVTRFFDVEKGDKVTMSRMEMDSHDGTHIDSPLHFIKGGSSIDEMPISTAIGPARVGGNGIFIKADVTAAKEVEAMVDRAMQSYGRLDYAHNNAGIEYNRASIVDCTEEDWMRVMDINLNSDNYVRTQLPLSTVM